MTNPQWPAFPGVANMATDEQGRPQTQDLIPGKQLGTALEAAFFNPLLRSVCDLLDSSTALSGKISGYLPLEGGALTGPLSVQDTDGSDPNTALNVKSADKRYTLQSAFTAEQKRVKDAVNNVVSGTLELSEGDQQGLGLHTQGSDQAVLYKDSGNGWRKIALYSDITALRNAISSEQERAKNVEGGLISGSYGSSPAGGDMAIKGLYIFGKLGTASATYEQNGKLNYLTLASQTMLTDAVGVESSRAQGAENKKLNRAGDVSSGNIIFDSGNVYQSWAASPQSIYRIGGGLMSLWGAN